MEEETTIHSDESPFASPNRKMTAVSSESSFSEDDREVTNDPLEVLSKQLSLIGMGSYQWKLFVLCGMGWVADNMVRTPFCEIKLVGRYTNRRPFLVSNVRLDK